MGQTRRDKRDTRWLCAEVGETHRNGGDDEDARRGAHNPEVAGSNPAPATKSQAPSDHGRGLLYAARERNGARVPVEDGSLTDLAAVVGQEVTAEQVNGAFEAAAGGALAGVLRYSTRPLVSRDILGDPASCVFDSGLTQADGTLVKVFGWYDNEWGYTCRLADLAAIIGAQL